MRLNVAVDAETEDGSGLGTVKNRSQIRKVSNPRLDPAAGEFTELLRQTERLRVRVDSHHPYIEGRGQDRGCCTGPAPISSKNGSS